MSDDKISPNADASVMRYDKAPMLAKRGMMIIGECGKYMLWTDYCLLKAELSAERARSRKLAELTRRLAKLKESSFYTDDEAKHFLDSFALEARSILGAREEGK